MRIADEPGAFRPAWILGVLARDLLDGARLLRTDPRRRLCQFQLRLRIHASQHRQSIRIALQLSLQVEAALLADRIGARMLVSNDEGNYGRYRDYFRPQTDREAGCVVTPGDYNPQRMLAERACQPLDVLWIDRETASIGNVDPPACVVHGSGTMGHLNQMVINLTVTPALLDSISPTDASAPLPSDATLPPLMRPLHDAAHAAWLAHFRATEEVASRIAHKRQRMHLGDGLVVGMHYRGGDKLRAECRPTPRMTCGNVTLHAEAAWATIASRYVRM